MEERDNDKESQEMNYKKENTKEVFKSSELYIEQITFSSIFKVYNKLIKFKLEFI